MLNALVAGERDPEVLAELAKGQLRRRSRHSGRHCVVASGSTMSRPGGGTETGLPPDGRGGGRPMRRSPLALPRAAVSREKWDFGLSALPGLGRDRGHSAPPRPRGQWRS
jgi:hypothetical protein